MPRHRAPATVGTSRIIAASLIGGVTIFALIAWFMVQESGPMGADQGQASLMFNVWLALAVAAATAAVVLWRLRVAPLIEAGDARSSARTDGESRSETIQAALLPVWALIEGPALFGIVVYLLFGSVTAYAGGLLLVWLGIGLTFPRAPWFAPMSTTRQGQRSG